MGRKKGAAASGHRKKTPTPTASTATSSTMASGSVTPTPDYPTTLPRVARADATGNENSTRSHASVSPVRNERPSPLASPVGVAHSSHDDGTAMGSSPRRMTHSHARLNTHTGRRSLHTQCHHSDTASSTSYSSNCWKEAIQPDKNKLRQFWFQMPEDRRRQLMIVEKEVLIKRMQQHQRRACRCEFCGVPKYII